jgi:hypothetical protein
MDGTFAALIGVGGIIKHVLPWKGVNRFIPLINWGVATVFNATAGGLDIAGAAVKGLQDALMATGGHQAVKNTVGAKLKIREQKL